MSADRPAPHYGGEGGHGDDSGDDGGARYHREVDDPPSWDDDAYALTGPVEAHGRGLDFGLLLLRCGPLALIPHGLHKAFDMPAFTREVTSSFNCRAPLSRSVSNAAPSVRCSKLSSTSSSRRPER